MTLIPHRLWTGRRPIHRPGICMDGGRIELDHERDDASDVTDAAFLDSLAAETARTDPWTAATTIFGGRS